MTAESIVPSPAGPPRVAEHTASVLPPRGSVAGLRLPAGQAARLRRTEPAALLSVDLTAALLGALVVPAELRHPLLVTLLILCAAWLSRHSSRHGRLPVPALLDELPALCGRAAVCWAVGAALVPQEPFPVDVLAAGCAAHCAVACAGRAAMYCLRRRALRRRPWPVLLLGPAPTARSVGAALLRAPGCGVRPVAIVSGSREACPELSDGLELPVLTTGQEVQRAVLQNGVTAVLALGASGRAENGAALRELARYGCLLWEIDPDSPSYVLGGRQKGAQHLAGFSCRLLSRGGGRPVLDTTAKRVLDLVLSGALLLLVGPVLLIRAALLRAGGGPGVMVREARTGKHGRSFALLAFRTRRRRSSLDGLPQLWNVFRGDMSLVGPQAEQPYRVAELSQRYPGYAARHRMRTGLTGLAQIHGLRGDTPVEDRCRFDNAYIDTWSLWQDVCILLRAAALSVRPTGS